MATTQSRRWWCTACFVMNAVWRVGVFVLLASGCATTGGVANSPRVEIEHPQSAAGFVAEDVYQADDPREGTRIRYVSEEFGGLRVDFFAYLVGQDEDHGRALDLLRDGFVESMALATQNGVYKSHEWLDRKSISLKVGEHERPARFLRHVQVSPNAGELVSHTFLLYRPPFALKVRASFPSNGNMSYDEAIQGLVAEVIPKLKVTLPAACRKDDRTVYVDPAGAACDLMAGISDMHRRAAESGCDDFEEASAAIEAADAAKLACEAELKSKPAK